MIVVADTGPLHYLVLMDAIEVLGQLYKLVIVPVAVIDELKNERTPEPVLRRISEPSAWLEVRPNPAFDPSLDFLGPGERAALSLAEFLNADELLIDDLARRREAEQRHMHVRGTLAVLADAHLAGLLDFENALLPLRTTNFRLSAELERPIRRRISSW